MDTIGLGRPARICIDPGHGGRDPGAVANGVTEKHVNLSVALVLQDVLTFEGHDVRMTREADTWLDLTPRGRFSVANECELFVSIHHDWVGNAGTPDPDRRGCSSFVRYESYRNGMDLGTRITEALVGEWEHGYTYGTKCQKHWVNLGVLRGGNNDGLVTATVVECGCLTSPLDAANAERDDYATRTARVLKGGIHRHLGLPDEGHEPETTPVKIITHGTSDVIATVQMVPGGDHIADQGKLYVTDTEVK